MAYDPLAIANTLLDIANIDGVKLTPMKLQKLVYFAHGWYLAIKGEPLIKEQVEAWNFGPVIPSLYHAFKRFGNQSISEYAISECDFESRESFAYSANQSALQKVPESDKFTCQLLKKIWNVYGKFTPVQLSNMTHEEGTPWDHLFKKFKGDIPRHTDIPIDLIQTYFANKGTQQDRKAS